MNKKLFLGMFAAATMLFATSCQNDELDAVQSGNEATVSFTLGVEDGVQTRAISDGKTADLLVYQVLDKAGNAISTLSKVEEKVTFPHELTLTLAKGQTYQIAFWAQNSQNTSAYSTVNFPTVEVSYNGINNDETRDAFFKTETVTVTGNAKLDVTLKRPFAQLNVGVYKSDWEDAVTSGVTIKESSVIIKNAGTSIDLRSGEVTGSDDLEVKYTSSAIPTEWLEVELDNKAGIDANEEQFHWLSMSYILVNDESEDGKSKATLADVDFTFYSSGEPIVLDEGLNNVPVQRNWRTNIIGKLLTGDVTFNIKIDPIYDGNWNYPDFKQIADGVSYDAETTGFLISSVKGMQWLTGVSNGTVQLTDDVKKLVKTNTGTLADGADKLFWKQTVKLTQDIDLNGIEWTPITKFHGTFDGDNHTISNMTATATETSPAGLFGLAKATIKNVKMTNVTVNSAKNGGAIAGWGDGIHIENCHVDGGYITITPITDADGKLNEGNSAGGIIGLLQSNYQSNILDCSVNNVTVQGYRDLGGIVGKVNKGTPKINNNRVTDVTIICDRREEEYYAKDTDPNMGAIIGIVDNSTPENTGNTENDVEMVVLRGDESVYEVGTAEDLFAVAAMINSGKDFGSKTIRLTQDIDLGGKNWEPINLYNAEKVLLAEIDGNNKSIKNMTIKGGSDNGFISMTAGTGKLTIKNLTFENPTIETTGSRVGTVIGHQYGQVELNGVKVTNGDFISTDEKGIKLGGLIGQSEHGATGAGNATLTLTGCVVEGCAFTGYHTLAGLVAYIGAEDMSSNITDCHSKNNTFYYKDSRSLGTNNPWSNYYNRGGHNDGTVASSCSTTGNVGSNLVADGIVKNAEGVYEISSAAGLVYANENLFSSQGVSFKLENDIDMSGVTNWGSGITSNNGFSFDGNEHTIRNWSTSGRGLFVDRHAQGNFSIKNLTLENCSVLENYSGDEESAGLLLGWLDNGTDNDVVIEGIVVKGGKVNSTNYAAALIGYVSNPKITVTNCTIDGVEIKGGGSVGAVFGHAGGKEHNISSCTVKNSTIQGEENKKTGYLVGTFNAGKTVITSCTGTGNKYSDGGELKHMIGRFIQNTGATLSIDGTSQDPFNHTER